MGANTFRGMMLILSWFLAAGALLSQERGTDRFGDALPSGAVARLGTVRWRHGEGAIFVAFLPDGKLLLSVGRDGTVREWEVATGKELRRFALPGRFPSYMEETHLFGEWVIFDTPVYARAIRLSANGKVLAFTNGLTIHLWDVSAGKELHRIKPPRPSRRFKPMAQVPANEGFAWVSQTKLPLSLALTSDGKTLAVQKKNGTIQLHDVATGKEVACFGYRSNKYHALGLALSGDGKRLAAVESYIPDMNTEASSEMTVWDTATETVSYRRPGKQKFGDDSFEHLQFSPDGRWLAWFNDNNPHEIVLADAATGREVHRLQTKDCEQLDEFRFASDSKALIAHKRMSGLCIWDAQTGRRLREFRRFSFDLWKFGFDESLGFALSPDSKLIALGAWDGPIIVLDIATGTERDRSGAPRRAIQQVSFARDGKEVHTVEEGRRDLTPDAASGTLMLSTDEGRGVHAWDAGTGKQLRTIATQYGASGYIWSRKGELVNSVWLQEFATGENVLLGDQDLEQSAWVPAVSADNKLLAVGGTKDKKQVTAVHEIATGKERYRMTLPTHVPDPEAVLLAPDGGTVAAQFADGKVALWNVAASRALPIIEPLREGQRGSLALSADGRSLAVDYGDGSPCLYETATGRLRRRFGIRAGETDDLAGKKPRRFPGARLLQVETLRGKKRTQPEVDLSPDGRILAHCGKRGTITLWNVAAGNELGQLTGHQADVMALSFSPDGKTLASGSRDTTGLIWDVRPFTAKAKPQASDVDAAAAWKVLLSEDAARAYDAMCALVAAPDKAVAFLKEHLHRVAPPDPEQVKRLIGDLDSEQFDVRKRAGAELEKLGEPALHLIRTALEGEPSLEARKRIEEMLRNASMAKLPAESLRALRAIEVLEMIGTAEAKTVLQALTQGAPEAAATFAARSALERLRR
jgi:WD40 repeat protein